jgi:hypothetical protein
MNNHPFLGALWLKGQGYQLADDPLFDTRYAQPNFLFPPPPFLPKQTSSFFTWVLKKNFAMCLLFHRMDICGIGAQLISASGIMFMCF